MALYKLTFADLKDEARHAISGDPDSRTSLDRIVNDALEYLVQLHPWSWRTTITTLDFTQDVAQIPLPVDFGELVELIGNQSSNLCVRVAPMATIMRSRVQGLSIGQVLLWALGMAAPVNAATPPLRVLEVAPTPSSALASALMLTYRRLIPTLVGDTDVPAIPYGFAGVFRTLVRAMAYSSTYQRPGHDWELFNQQIPQYVAADALAQGNHTGRLTSQLDTDWGMGELTLGQTVLIEGE